MPTQVGWLIENRVLYSQSTGAIDMDLVIQHADFLVELLSNGQTTDIHLIIDSLKLTKFRVDIVKLNGQTKRYLEHPRLKCNIDVTRNVKNQMLGNVVSDMAGVRWAHYETLEAALNFLNDFDETLPPLDTNLLTTFKPLKEID